MWDGVLIPIVNGIKLVDVVSGIVSDPFLSILSVPDYVETLEASGPTNGTIGIPGLSLSIPFLGADFSIGAFVDLTYAITISSGSNVLMDQADVSLYALTIDFGRGTRRWQGRILNTD